MQGLATTPTPSFPHAPTGIRSERKIGLLGRRNPPPGDVVESNVNFAPACDGPLGGRAGAACSSSVTWFAASDPPLPHMFLYNLNSPICNLTSRRLLSLGMLLRVYAGCQGTLGNKCVSETSLRARVPWLSAFLASASLSLGTLPGGASTVHVLGGG